MTSTLTRPPAASRNDAPAPPALGAPGAWLTSADHKHLGLLFIYGGLAALLATAIGAVLFNFPGVDVGTQLWTRAGSRLAAVNVSAGLIIGMPALWIGLASYVVPLQIGATRLALPRLHSLALWTYFAGGVLTATGYLADHTPIPSLASSAPAVAGQKGGAEAATQLLIAGLILVALATFLASISLLVSVLARRAEGLRLHYLPLFAWSTMVTATVAVLATPVFLAGLVLLFYDQHYGGPVFTSGPGGLRIWQHEVWVLGQPMALLFGAACIGLFGDIVATHARRPLVGLPLARVAAAAAPLLTLLLWTGKLSSLVSPFSPLSTLGAVTVGLPLALSLLVWLATLKAGRPHPHASLLLVAGFLIVVGLAAGLSVAGVIAGIEASNATAFRNGQITLLVWGAPLLGLSAAVLHWSPKISGRPLGGAPLVALLLLAGVVLMAAPSYIVGFGGDSGTAVIGCAGAGLVGAGLLMVLAALIRPPTPGAGDPYGGLTLEWGTASPPPPHNFDELPEIGSAYPLAGARDGDA